MSKWNFLLELILRSILPPFYSILYMEKVCKRKQEKYPHDPYVMWFLGNLYIWHKKYPEAQVQLENLDKIWRNYKKQQAVAFTSIFQYE